MSDTEQFSVCSSLSQQNSSQSKECQIQLERKLNQQEKKQLLYLRQQNKNLNYTVNNLKQHLQLLKKRKEQLKALNILKNKQIFQIQNAPISKKLLQQQNKVVLLRLQIQCMQIRHQDKMDILEQKYQKSSQKILRMNKKIQFQQKQIQSLKKKFRIMSDRNQKKAKIIQQYFSSGLQLINDVTFQNADCHENPLQISFQDQQFDRSKLVGTPLDDEEDKSTKKIYILKQGQNLIKVENIYQYIQAYFNKMKTELGHFSAVDKQIFVRKQICRLINFLTENIQDQEQ